MERVDKILQHKKFRKCVKKNKKAEKKRIFCKHDMVHFLDVARIAWILNLEKGLEIKKDVVYGAALLHDIGRFKQYEDGMPHEKASAKLAPEILKDCGYTEEESAVILEAISRHRDKTAAEEENLVGILYLADKASRPCFSCDAEKLCNWKNDKKNVGIKY